jgi:hypothetical protein
MAEVRSSESPDGVSFQITLTGEEVRALDRGDIVEFSDPNVGPNSRNWIKVRLAKRIDDI